jgi:hypothetical protein
MNTEIRSGVSIRLLQQQRSSASCASQAGPLRRGPRRTGFVANPLLAGLRTVSGETERDSKQALRFLGMRASATSDSNVHPRQADG